MHYTRISWLNGSDLPCLHAAEVGKQALYVACDLLQRVVGWHGHNVTDMPVLHFISPGGITFLELQLMLGFLQSNDVISSPQITLLNL